MASFSAELHVEGTVFPVRHCHFEVQQATHERGRVSTKVRYGPVQLTLDVPAGEELLAWAADPHKRLAANVLFRDANGGSVVESLRMKAAHCVVYSEVFVAGDMTTGAYVANMTLVDPDGFTLQAGGPAAAFVAPAAREHGQPVRYAAAVAGAVASAAAPALRRLVSPRDIPPHLPAPQPNPSPDHAQVQVSPAEWATIIAGRWERNEASKRKKFTLAPPHRNTEFTVAGDPFTYRVDGQGKVVAVYDAQTQQSYNITGTRKGLKGIPLTLNGEPTYAGTEHMMPVATGQKNVVVIPMAGSRPKDFQLANEAAGLTDLVKSQGLKPHQAPLGYTWHHRDDFTANPTPPPYGTCTMELVEAQAHHKTFVHYGACDQLNEHVGQKLYV